MNNLLDKENIFSGGIINTAIKLQINELYDKTQRRTKHFKELVIEETYDNSKVVENIFDINNSHLKCFLENTNGFEDIGNKYIKKAELCDKKEETINNKNLGKKRNRSNNHNKELSKPSKKKVKISEPPICDKCKVKMILKTSKKDKKFWVCKNYFNEKKCKKGKKYR
jgi:phage tail sheath protein FI